MGTGLEDSRSFYHHLAITESQPTPFQDLERLGWHGMAWHGIARAAGAAEQALGYVSGPAHAEEEYELL